MNITSDILKKCIQEIQKLNPKPGGAFINNQKIIEHIIPDFFINIVDENLELTLNQKNNPNLFVSKNYTHLLNTYKNSKNKEEKEAVHFVHQKIQNAKWFINAVKERSETLLKTITTIIDIQKKYLLSGDESELKPLKLKDIADKIEMDISTVSRIVNRKYVSTPYGTKKLKFFFSDKIENKKGEEISTTKIKTLLKEIIQNEKSPLNDQELTTILEEKGYLIARRTVSKYREQLKIPVARLRKKL